MVAQLPQRLKSTFLKKFLHSDGPFEATPFEKILILAFEANSALSHENETKIVKITHSALASASHQQKSAENYLGFFQVDLMSSS